MLSKQPGPSHKKHGHRITLPAGSASRIFVVTGEAELSCPCCGGALVYRDRRQRKARDESGTWVIYRLRRLRCQDCGKLHTELPDFLLPYKRYCRAVFEEVLSGKNADIPLELRTHGKFRAWYRRLEASFKSWKARMTQEGEFCFPQRHPFTLLDMVICLVQGGGPGPRTRSGLFVQTLCV